MNSIRHPCLAWLGGLLLLCPLGRAVAQVTIQKADSTDLELTDKPVPVYTVKAQTYAAEIYSNGRVRLLAGKTELVSNLVFDLDRKEAVLADIRRDGETRLILHEGELKKSKVDQLLDDKGDKGDKGGPEIVEAAPVKTPDLPGMTLDFLPDRIEIGFVKMQKQKAPQNGMAAAYNLQGVLGGTASAVRNLRTEEVDALPADRAAGRHFFAFYQGYGHVWPDLEIAYADGTRVELHGITGVGHYAIGRRDPYTSLSLNSTRGYWALRDLNPTLKTVLTVHPAKPEAAVAPAPYFTAQTGKPKNLYFEDEPVTLALDFPADYVVPGAWRLSWHLEDHMQRPAGDGSQDITLTAGKSQQLTVDLKPSQMGFFRVFLRLQRADGAKAAVKTYEFNFARIRPEFPAFRDLIGKDDGEMVLANLIGMRGLRTTPSLAGIWSEFKTEDGDIDWKSYEKKLADYMDLARRGTVKGVVALMSGSPAEKDMAKWFDQKYTDPEERKKEWAAAQTKWVTAWAASAKKCGINAWEPINEPDLGMGQEGYIESFLKPQYAAIKAGNPQADFLGGSCCGLEKQFWVRRLYELGGQQYFDGTSFHPYTGLGFQEIYRAELDQWWQVLRDYKDEKQTIWMTEAAWHRGWGFNDYVYDRFQAVRESQAQHAALMYLNAEAFRIPRDRIYVFYLEEHGYNDFYLFYYTQPTAAAIAIQVMNECLRDAKFEKELLLPDERHHLQLFRDAQRTVAAAFTNAEPAELLLATDAADVTVTDIMGNRRSVKPENGRLKLGITGDPTYVTLPAGAKLEPLYDGLQVQPNLALAVLGASATASSVVTPKPGEAVKAGLGINGAISGDWSGYASREFGQVWGWEEDGAGKDKWPDWYEVKLPQPVPVSRVRVFHEYGGWARTLRDYDVQCFVNGDWKTVAAVRGNFYANITDHVFAPETTDRVRVFITLVNSCLFGTIDWIPHLSALRAVQLFAAPAGAAKAFFVPDLLRKRVLKPGEATEWRVSLRNITATPLTGELRVQTVAGVTAEKTAVPLTLAAGATAEAVVKLTLAADSADGVYAVVAGLYEGDKLVSSDRAVCSIGCRKPPPPKAPPAAKPAGKQGDDKKDDKDKAKKDEPKDTVLDDLMKE